MHPIYIPILNISKTRLDHVVYVCVHVMTMAVIGQACGRVHVTSFSKTCGYTLATSMHIHALSSQHIHNHCKAAYALAMRTSAASAACASSICISAASAACASAMCLLAASAACASAASAACVCDHTCKTYFFHRRTGATSDAVNTSDAAKD